MVPRSERSGWCLLGTHVSLKGYTSGPIQEVFRINLGYDERGHFRMSGKQAKAFMKQLAGCDSVKFSFGYPGPDKNHIRFYVRELPSNDPSETDATLIDFKVEESDGVDYSILMKKHVVFGVEFLLRALKALKIKSNEDVKVHFVGFFNIIVVTCGNRTFMLPPRSYW